MLERPDAQEGPEESDLSRAQKQNAADRPMADREVPIPGGDASEVADVAVAVHQWLDGEETESVARRADSRQVDLWKHIAEETDRRRRMATPAYVPARIMAALPAKAPQAATSFWERPFALAPATAMIAGAGLLALGIVIGKLVLR